MCFIFTNKDKTLRNFMEPSSPRTSLATSSPVGAPGLVTAWLPRRPGPWVGLGMQRGDHSPAPSKQRLRQRLKLWQSQLPGRPTPPSARPCARSMPSRLQQELGRARLWPSKCACLEKRRGPNRLGGGRRAHDPERQVQGRGLSFFMVCT